jgi:hypothetical protein
MATAAAVVAAYGCNGPISDWPPKAGSGDGTGTPVTGMAGGGATPGGVRDASVSVPPALGGSVAGGSPGGVGATPGGGVTGGAIGGQPPGGLPGSGGGTAGGVADAGTGTSMDAGVSEPPADAGASDAGDASLLEPDAGDSGWPSDAACSFVPIDAAVVPGADAEVCAAYGCGVTLTTLGQLVTPGGACGSTQALSVACTGELARAAMICTQENALGLGLGRQVTTCLRRASHFSQVPSDCLQCYADESLCTLSRCFVACIDGSDPACEQCRAQSCGEPFRKCSGLPPTR